MKTKQEGGTALLCVGKIPGKESYGSYSSFSREKNNSSRERCVAECFQKPWCSTLCKMKRFLLEFRLAGRRRQQHNRSRLRLRELSDGKEDSKTECTWNLIVCQTE